MPLLCVFFDVGNTLGTVDTKLHLFENTEALLEELQALGLRLGVISNLPPTFSNAQLIELLLDADILHYFDPNLIISSKGADKKPGPAIYMRAAQAAGVAIDECMFVGEDLGEVIGAQAAGMSAQHKPQL